MNSVWRYEEKYGYYVQEDRPNASPRLFPPIFWVVYNNWPPKRIRFVNVKKSLECTALLHIHFDKRTINTQIIRAFAGKDL